MTYPLKFREHVLAVKSKENLTFAQTAQKFSIGIASVMRWDKKINPVLKRNKPALKINTEALQKDVVDYPDDFMYERAQRFNVSISGISHALKRLAITHKKNVKPSQS